MTKLPIISATFTHEMDKVIENYIQLKSIIKSEMSPVSISLPEAAVRNVSSFQTTIESLSINGRVFLAHKATNSLAVLKSLLPIATIDVASVKELHNALSVGYSPENIIATGPKSNAFLRQLRDQSSLTIIVDSFSELKRLDDIADGKPISILLRLTRSILNQATVVKRSRFGVDESNLKESLKYIAARSHIILRGLAFHLDSQSIEERQQAVRLAISKLLSVQQKGFIDCTILDIGGGYGSDSGISQAETVKFETAMKNMVTNDGPDVTWQSRSFGLKYDGNKITGDLVHTNISSSPTGADRLKAVLELKDQSGLTLAQQINENLIELWIEPGSAVCNDAGMFAVEVIEVRNCDGEDMVVVDAHRNQLSFEDMECVADPLLLSVNSGTKSDSEQFEAYVAGHLCLENDFMTYRKIRFPHQPQQGDILLWSHTGAYATHFSASLAIGHNLPAPYFLDANGALSKDIL